MIHDRAQLAACIAISYTAVMLGGVIQNFLSTGDIFTLKYSLMLTSTWIASILSGVISWGLWHCYRWAWWLGLASALTLLATMSSRLFQYFTDAKPTGIGVFLIFALVITFLVVLVLPRTRAECAINTVKAHSNTKAIRRDILISSIPYQVVLLLFAIQKSSNFIAYFAILFIGVAIYTTVYLALHKKFRLSSERPQRTIFIASITLFQLIAAGFLYVAS